MLLCTYCPCSGVYISITDGTIWGSIRWQTHTDMLVSTCSRKDCDGDGAVMCDMDVMGVAFRRDLFVTTRQVYPELQERKAHNPTQDKLLRKLGQYFPDNLPCSVALQPAPDESCSVSKCAVEFEVKAFCADQSGLSKGGKTVEPVCG
uniref:Uncharacterized protein n=1 Tax=Neogobius melanostomus TaxID=47308 RepID=A0A8C6SHG3_9GOBI